MVLNATSLFAEWATAAVSRWAEKKNHNFTSQTSDSVSSWPAHSRLALRVKWQTASQLLSVCGVACCGWNRDWTSSSKNLCFQSLKSHHSLEWDMEQYDWARPRVLSLRCVIRAGEPPPSGFSTSVSHTLVEPDGGLKLLESLQDNFGWERISESTRLWTDLSTWGSTETRSSIISLKKCKRKEINSNSSMLYSAWTALWTPIWLTWQFVILQRRTFTGLALKCLPYTLCCRWR